MRRSSPRLAAVVGLHGALALGCAHHHADERELEPVIGYHHVVVVRLVGGWNEMVERKQGAVGLLKTIAATDHRIHDGVMEAVQAKIVHRLDEKHLPADVQFVDVEGYLNDAIRIQLDLPVISVPADAKPGIRTAAKALNAAERVAASMLASEIGEEIEAAGGVPQVDIEKGDAAPLEAEPEAVSDGT